MESNSPPAVPTVYNVPSIVSANWLYLVSMLLILSIGAALQSASFSWGLIGTELFLILLPTMVVLRLKRLPPAETLRLRWPGWAAVGLGLLAGIGLWFFAETLDGFMMALFDYAPPSPPDAFPTTIGQAALLFAALAISAPLCEEIMFRGYIQRAYAEGRGQKQALVITSLMFAFFHFRLQGLVVLLPLAFALGYLRLRSNSLWPAVALHFGANGAATIFVVIATLRADWLANLPMDFSSLALAGLVVALVSLWLFACLTSGKKLATAVSPSTLSATSRFSWQALLPLVAAALLYLFMGGLEFVYGRMPERIATEPLTLNALEFEQEREWEYDIRNALDESVGQAACTLTPTGADFTLHCQTEVQAFKAELPSSTFQAEAHSSQLTVQWRGDDLEPVAGQYQITGSDFSSFWRLESTASDLTLVSDAAGSLQTLDLPGDVLLPEEWVWRFMALPFTLGLGQQANYAWPALWQQETQTSVPTVEEMSVVVSRAEPVTTPAGDFIAWRVEMGRWTAWYDVNAPHTLLQYDAGFATFMLNAVR